MEIVLEFVKLLVALIVLGLSNRQGVELLKTFWNFLVSKAAWLSLHNKATFVFAAAVAFAVVQIFGVDLTQYLSVLDGYDPRLMEIVSALLLALASNFAHDKLTANASQSQ